MSTIRSKAPTFRLGHEKLKGLKEEQVKLKKGRGHLFPFGDDVRERLLTLDEDTATGEETPIPLSHGPF